MTVVLDTSESQDNGQMNSVTIPQTVPKAEHLKHKIDVYRLETPYQFDSIIMDKDIMYTNFRTITLPTCSRLLPTIGSRRGDSRMS